MKQPIKLTSHKPGPNKKLLTLAWKVMAKADVRKFTLRVGTEPGKWDIFNGELNKDIKEMTLPPVAGNPKELFAELDYSTSEDQDAAPRGHTARQPHRHHHGENIMHGERPIKIPLA